MFGLIGVILIVAGLVGIVLPIALHYLEEPRGRKKIRSGFILLGVCVFIGGLLAVAGTAEVPAGSRGVGIIFGGQVSNRQIPEGLAFKIPFVENVIAVDVRVQAHEFSSIDAASKEMQSVKLWGNVNWKFDPQYVPWIYQNIGASKDFVDKILDKSLQDFLKEVSPRYAIMDTLQKRSEIRSETVRILSESLVRYHIIIEDIYIADIQFSPEYMAAIEKQQVAERQITTERNILEQKKIQAEQLNTQAIGEANANATRAEGEKRAAITRADGEGQAILTVANAQAKANKTVNETLTQEIINYTAVQKLAPDIKVIILPAGQNFILPEALIGK